MKVLKYFFSFLIIALTAAITVFYLSPKGKMIIEMSAPSISFVSPLSSAGSSAYSLKVIAKDKDSGIGRISIWINDGSETKLLNERKYSLYGNKKEEFTLDVNFPEIGYENGNIQLIAEVEDKSFWKRTSRFIHGIAIDVEAPQIELINQFSNIQPGKPNLIFYKVNEAAAYDKGVLLGDNCYIQGYRSVNILEDLSETHLKDSEEVWLSIFAAPPGWKKADGAWVFSIDASGNASSIDLTGSDKVLDSKNLKGLVEKQCGNTNKLLLDFIPYSKRRNYINGNFNFAFYVENKGLILSESGAKKFQSIVEKSWNRKVKFKRNDNFTISSPNNGIIQYVGNSRDAKYKDVVIIDHGLGITSVYYGVTDPRVAAGDFIEKGEFIGDIRKINDNYVQVEFEIYTGNVPFIPRYWFNAKNFMGLFLNKVEQVALEVETLGR